MYGSCCYVAVLICRAGVEQKSVFLAAAFSVTPQSAVVLMNSNCTAVTASWGVAERRSAVGIAFEVGEGVLHGSDGKWW